MAETWSSQGRLSYVDHGAPCVFLLLTDPHSLLELGSLSLEEAQGYLLALHNTLTGGAARGGCGTLLPGTVTG